MIIRAIHNRNNPYFMVRRDTAQHAQLPARALGVLVYLMSKPDTWEPTIADIRRRFPDIGRNQAYQIINEVFIPLGYARRVCEKRDGKILRWITEIYETPVPQNRDVVTSSRLPVPQNRELDNTEEKIQIENIEEEITDVGADAQPTGKKAKRQPDARTQHVAIQLCREITNRYPPKEIWDKVIETLGGEPDAALLSNCRAEWVERGYNRASWKWATEWYVSGVPARTATSPPKKPDPGAPTPYTLEDAARLEEIFSMDDWITGCIERDDRAHLEMERKLIAERGGPKEPWEFRVYEFLNAATEAQ